VNVITGTSDSGKTAILRSLSWLINNRPSGDAFKNWDVPLKESVSVSLELEDGNSIVLERQNGKNTYSIFDKNGEETKFSAIKTDVPKEVTELLNLAEYNSQSQHQSYFLLQDTPGEIAKKLNDLVGLSIIDTLFSNIASQVRQTSIKISVLTSDRDNAEKDLKQYEKLDEIGNIIENLEKLYEKTAGITSSLNFIEQKLSAFTKIKEEREKLIPLIKLEPRMIDLSRMIGEVSVVESQIQNIQKAASILKDLQQEIETEKMWLDLEPSYTTIYSDIEELLSLENKKNSLIKYISVGGSMIHDINKGKRYIKELASQYLDLIKESNTCPTCGNRIDAARLAAIERSFS
jgi:DNA repair protein SbcC/Rad50